jgi:hypothetical protein
VVVVTAAEAAVTVVVAMAVAADVVTNQIKHTNFQIPLNGGIFL